MNEITAPLCQNNFYLQGTVKHACWHTDAVFIVPYSDAITALAMKKIVSVMKRLYNAAFMQLC